MTLSFLLLLVAFVIFLLDAFGWIKSASVKPVSLGLAFVVLAMLAAGHGPVLIHSP